MVTAAVTVPLISQGSGVVAVVCLVLGVVLIVSGATIQFGGTSLF